MPLTTLDLALATLRDGNLVAFPTETVYGLGADALDPAAVAKVFALKGRPATNPLIVHIHTIDAARALTTTWPAAATLLAERFWPGPLTIVLPKAPQIPALVTAQGPTVALRIPRHPRALELLAALGRPLVGPSANPSGSISPTTAQHVLDSLGNHLPVLDGGPCTAGIESTVVDPISLRILRPGLITAHDIAQATGLHFTPATNHAAKHAAPILPSPGLLARHYAPTTPALLVEPAAIDTLLRDRTRCVVLATSARRVPPQHTLIQMPPGPRDYAARLYAALRDADSAHAELILIERPEATAGDAELWLAVLDRLTRATTSNTKDADSRRT